MRSPKFSTKRVLGLITATALAVSGVVAVAGSSEAAVTALTLSPKTGPSASTTQVISVTGKGFMTGSTSNVGVVEFQATSCSGASGGGSAVAVTVKSVVSATKLTITTPSLALTGTSTAWYLCVYDATPAIIGGAKYTVYAAPTYTSKSTVSGSNLGGTAVDFVGTNFTKAAKVTVDGVAATKVTYGTATTISAVFPAHAASATAVNVVITTEGGDVAAGTFTYVRGTKISPATGTVGTLHTIDIIGAGFNATSAATVSLTNGPLIAANVKFSCANIQIVSPTELTCDVPTTVTAGAYSVIVADVATVAATTGTVISSTSTYTAAAF